MTDVTFGHSLHAAPPRLSILISDLEHDIPITAYITPNPTLPRCLENGLFTAWPSFSESEKIDECRNILRLLRNHYGSRRPQFGNAPFIRTRADSGEVYVSEELDPKVAKSLFAPADLLSRAATTPKLVRRSMLRPCALTTQSPKSWSSQIQLVTLSKTHFPQFANKQFIAKGPSTASDFSELKFLLSLPEDGCASVMAPPVGLVTDVFDGQEMALGFLLEYHSLGALDSYSRRLFQAGKLSEKKVWNWGRQLVEAVAWIHLVRGSYHGDIKPDNIVIKGKKKIPTAHAHPQGMKFEEDEEELVLIDFSQDTFTAATSAPELREGWSVDVRRESVAGGVKERLLYHEYPPSPPLSPPPESSSSPREIKTPTPAAYYTIPKSWPAKALELADVYAVGRTLYILSQGLEMKMLYRSLFENDRFVYQTTYEDSGVGGGSLRRVVEMCTRKNPLERPGLKELVGTFEGGWK
ncbi:hypothetical protein RUND412_010492 [Rhizina undulata]